MGRVCIDNALRVRAAVWIHQHGQLGAGLNVARQDQRTRNLFGTGTNELHIGLHERFFTERGNAVRRITAVKCCADSGGGTRQRSTCSSYNAGRSAERN